MPELPEVETIVRELHSQIAMRRIKNVKVRLNKIVRTGPRRLQNLVKNEIVEKVSRRGKFIVISLTNNKYIIIHLKMTGQFLWGNPSEEWPRHVHVGIYFEDGRLLLYRDMRQFGYLLGLSQDEYSEWLASQTIGPDPFQISADDFTAMLTNRRGRIKPLLLNQGFISGLGNIYVDESLFAAGIHPCSSAEKVSPEQAGLLHREMVRILTDAINSKGSTTDNYVSLSGSGGEYQKRHQVYGKKGNCCPRCGETLERDVIGGRGTHFCPACQPCES